MQLKQTENNSVESNGYNGQSKSDIMDEVISKLTGSVVMVKAEKPSHGAKNPANDPTISVLKEIIVRDEQNVKAAREASIKARLAVTEADSVLSKLSQAKESDLRKLVIIANAVGYDITADDLHSFNEECGEENCKICGGGE